MAELPVPADDEAWKGCAVSVPADYWKPQVFPAWYDVYKDRCRNPAKFKIPGVIKKRGTEEATGREGWMCQFDVPPPAEPDKELYCIPDEELAKYVPKTEIRKIKKAQNQQTVAQEAAGEAGGAAPKRKRKKPPDKGKQKRTKRAKQKAKGRKQKKQTAKAHKADGTGGEQ